MRVLQALCFLLILSAAPGGVAGDSYTLSMLPHYSSEEINRRITPLAEYLTQVTGTQVEPVVTSDFGQYEKQLKSASITMGFENPYIYTLVSDTHQALAMAVKDKDRDKFRGIIITRKDRGLKGLAELRGRTVSIVGHTSAGGYLSQKLFLMKMGIDVSSDCTITEAADNKQENVILAVYAGEADAGFIRESALHVADDYISPSQIKVLADCAWLPNWAFSVDRALPEPIKKEIQNALVLLEPNHPVMQALNIDSFRVAGDVDYDPVRLAVGLR